MFSLNLNDFVLVWMSLLYEALPFVALGSILSGMVDVFVSRQTVARCVPRNRFVGIIAAAFLGLFFPMCECGIVPVVRCLVAKGVPPACAIAYMLAAPIVHPLVIVSTWVAFRHRGATGMVLLRVGMGVGVAIGIALVLWQFVGEEGLFKRTAIMDDGDEDIVDRRSVQRRILAGLQVAADDFATFGVFLVLGTAAAALINSGFHRSAIAPLADLRAASVGGMMVLAVLLNVCSEADAFIAASFHAFHVAAKLAFLVLGPMFDLKLLMMFAVVFRRRTVALLVALIVISVFSVCYLGWEWMPLVLEGLPQ